MSDTPFTFSPVPDVARFQLGNGLQLLVFESHSSPYVAFRMVLPGGGLSDPDGLEGLASLTAVLMRCGAGDRSEAELSEALDFLAARLSLTAGREYNEMSGDVTTLSPGQLPEFLDLAADVVLRPTFPEEELDKARTRRLGHLQQLADDHAGLCTRAFELTVFEGHPFGRASSGSRETVPRIGREAVAGCHGRLWSPEQALVALAGDVTPDSALALVEDRFGEWTAGAAEPVEVPPSPRHDGIRVTLVDRQDPSLSQVHFRIGHPATARLGADGYFAYRLAAQLLGGDFTARLNRRLRVQEGLTYGARYTFSVGSQRSGSASVVTYTPAKAARRAVDMALEELRRFREEPLAAEEVLDFQRKLIHSFPFRFETPAGTVDQYLWATREGLPDTFLKDYQRTLAAVTPEAVLEAAREHIRADDLDVVLVGNADMAEAFEDLAGEEGVIVRGVGDFGI